MQSVTWLYSVVTIKAFQKNIIHLLITCYQSCILSVNDKLCLIKIYLLEMYLIIIQRSQSMEKRIAKFSNIFQPLLFN